MFETRKMEHGVRLTKRDIQNGNVESADVKMGKEGQRLAKRSTQCSKGIDWTLSKVITAERILNKESLERALNLKA